MEMEVQRLKRKSESLEQQLATSRTAALAMVARIEQLEVGGSKRNNREDYGSSTNSS